MGWMVCDVYCTVYGVQLIPSRLVELKSSAAKSGATLSCMCKLDIYHDQADGRRRLIKSICITEDPAFVRAKLAIGQDKTCGLRFAAWDLPGRSQGYICSKRCPMDAVNWKGTQTPPTEAKRYTTLDSLCDSIKSNLLQAP
jgi:hypothetical protein